MGRSWGKWPLWVFVLGVTLIGTQGRIDPLFLARLEWEAPILKISDGDFPRQVQALGPLGGRVERQVKNWMELASLQIPTGIIADRDPNPEKLSVLPKLCPRLELVAGAEKGSRAYLYQGSLDRLNHVPMLQLWDGTGWQNDHYLSYRLMDGSNVLLLKKITLHYDYEDSNIVDYAGPSPKTGKPTQVHEGSGGFYANLHYAIVPFRSEYLGWNSQELLHLAQGRLKELGKNRYRPELRTHSFLPGPFLSGGSRFYSMCEWGDTAYQAPLQELEYENLALWDFDFPVKGGDHLLMIVFESDHEDHLLRDRAIPRNHLADDLIGVFEIRKDDFNKEVKLVNARGDFEISLQIGDLKQSPVALWKKAVGLPWRAFY
jgi:hypothetical protein